MRDVILTVVVAIVLALLFVYALLTVAFGGWGDRSPQPTTSVISDTAPSANIDAS